MKKLIFQSMLVAALVFGIGTMATANANSHKPPRPEKLEEIKSDQPSEYHTWDSGRWKWERKQEQWKWQEGKWRFDHDLYAFRNRYRFSNYYRPNRIRYYVIPIGRGYYRIVAL